MARVRLAVARRLLRWRRETVETIVWTLRLSGWLGLASLAQSLTSGPLPAFGWMAVWLLALGSASGWVGRIAPGRAVRRAALLGAVLIVSASLSCSVLGAVWLLPATLAWAALVALAAAAARACASGERASGRAPVRAAAAGAVLTWAGVGDIGDLHALVPRLIGLVAGAGLLLVLLLSRRRIAASDAAHPSDCSLPTWSGDCWRNPRHWPVGLASFAMLPMMCSLPWMVSLCRSDSASARVVLGVHFMAMFLPALLVARRAAIAARAAPVCALLLALGAAVPWLAPGGGPWWLLAATHGAAWSVSWAVRPGAARPRPRAAAWRDGAASSVCGVALGVGVATGGLQTLQAWPVALGVAAVASLAVAWLLAPGRAAPGRELGSGHVRPRRAAEMPSGRRLRWRLGVLHHHAARGPEFSAGASALK